MLGVCSSFSRPCVQRPHRATVQTDSIPVNKKRRYDLQSTKQAHFEHRFPTPSSKLCQIWLRHWRDTGYLYVRATVHRRGQRPPKGLGTNMTGSSLAPKHPRKYETRPPRVQKQQQSSVSWFKRLWYYLCWSINDTPCFISVVCNKLTTVWALTKNCSFSGTYDVTKYGSGRLSYTSAWSLQSKATFSLPHSGSPSWNL